VLRVESDHAPKDAVRKSPRHLREMHEFRKHQDHYHSSERIQGDQSNGARWFEFRLYYLRFSYAIRNLHAFHHQALLWQN
jgi:hypothetical protein